MGVFEVTRVQSVRESQPYIQVYFSDTLDVRQNLSGLVRLGDTTPRTRIEGNVLKIYPEANFANSESTVNLAIETGIKNDNGDRLMARFERAVVFQTQKPQVRFAGKGVILPENPVLTIPFEAVGVNAVRVTAFKIFDNNISQFLQNNKLDGSRELQRVGRYLWRRTIQLSPPEPGKWNRYTLDATELFDKHPGELFRLSLSITRADATTACPAAATPDRLNRSAITPANHEDLYVQEHSNWGYYEEYYGQVNDGSTWQDKHDPCKDAYYRYTPGAKADRNFLASNIGLLVKRQPAGKLFIVATDLRTSEPMSGVNLTVMNFQDQEIGRVRSNTNGFAELDTRETPFYLLAEKGGGKGYLKLSKGTALPVSHFDVGGENVTRGFKGFIYGERGVWRPGDDIFLTFVLEDEENLIPREHPVTLDLISPRGQLVERQTNTSPVGRFYKFALKTADDAPTGLWSAKAKIGGTTFSKTLRIETVMPNRLKVELDFGPEGLVRLERSDIPLQGELFGQWLSGATAAGLDADVKVRLRSTPTRFGRNADFEFDDPAREFTGEPETIFEGTLDGDGLVHIEARFHLEQSAPGMLNASFTSRVFEKGGAFSTSRTSLPFSPYNHYVGVRLPKGDSRRNMLLTDVDHTVELATLNASGEPVSIDKIHVALYKIDWRWWWDKSGESLAQYSTATHTGVITQDAVSTVDGKGTWQFQIRYPAWGRYLLRACDTSGSHCSGKVFYIDWPGWAGRAQEQAGPGASALTFVSDKPSYSVGEVAHIQLPEATEGRALFTVETGTNILEGRWVTLGAGAAAEPLELPITAEMSPNVYVSVTLVQPHAGKSNDRPIRMYGIILLTVNDPATRLRPVLSAPEEWRPETTASIKVSEASGQAMNYTVAIVDEGLLGLTSFKTPNLHDQFYKREALGISTWDLFDDVVGAYGGELERLLALGGGAGADIEQEAERKRFPPVVTFLGPFELDPRSENEHSFALPQYIGAVRVMVVAGNDSAYGSVSKSVFVRQPLMLLPTMPRVIGPNEKLKVPVSTFVMDPTIENVTLKIDPGPQIEVVGSDTLSLTFEEPTDKMGFFELAIGPTLGKATVRVTALSGRHRAEAAIDIDIRAPNPPTTRMMRIKLEPGESWETHVAPHGLRGTNDVTLEVSAVPPLDLERRARLSDSLPSRLRRANDVGSVPGAVSDEIDQTRRQAPTSRRAQRAKSSRPPARLSNGHGKLRLLARRILGREHAEQLGHELRRTFPRRRRSTRLLRTRGDDVELDQPSEVDRACVGRRQRECRARSSLSSLYTRARERARDGRHEPASGSESAASGRSLAARRRVSPRGASRRRQRSRARRDVGREPRRPSRSDVGLRTTKPRYRAREHGHARPSRRERRSRAHPLRRARLQSLAQHPIGRVRAHVPRELRRRRRHRQSRFRVRGRSTVARARHHECARRELSTRHFRQRIAVHVAQRIGARFVRQHHDGRNARAGSRKSIRGGSARFGALPRSRRERHQRPAPAPRRRLRCRDERDQRRRYGAHRSRSQPDSPVGLGDSQHATGHRRR